MPAEGLGVPHPTRVLAVKCGNPGLLIAALLARPCCHLLDLGALTRLDRLEQMRERPNELVIRRKDLARPNHERLTVQVP